MKKFLKTDEILNIYKKKEQGVSLQVIANETGVSYGSVLRCLRILKKIMLGQKKRVYSQYVKALKIIKSNGVITTKTPTTQPMPIINDPFDRLNTAYEAFTKEIGIFVETMMNKRAQGILTELKAQREANKKLVEAVEVAKNANWITSLKQKFQ